jgi:hypothetical protein
MENANANGRGPIPAEIVFVAYRDPVGEGPRFGPDDPYGMECLVPVVGPSSYLMWVKLARQVAASDTPVRFDVVDLFRSIGLGHHTGRNSAGVRTLARMASFAMLVATDNLSALEAHAWAPVGGEAVSRASPRTAASTLDDHGVRAQVSRNAMARAAAITGKTPSTSLKVTLVLACGVFDVVAVGGPMRAAVW